MIWRIPHVSLDLSILALLGTLPANNAMYDSPLCCPAISRTTAKEPDDEDSKNAEGPSSQDLRYALGDGSKTSRLGITGRQTHYLGCLYHKQSPRHSFTIFMGDDLRICTKWQFRRLWWSRQHLLRIQPQSQQRQPYSCGQRIVRTLRLSFLLSIYQ